MCDVAEGARSSRQAADSAEYSAGLSESGGGSLPCGGAVSQQHTRRRRRTDHALPADRTNAAGDQHHHQHQQQQQQQSSSSSSLIPFFTLKSERFIYVGPRPERFNVFFLKFLSRFDVCKRFKKILTFFCKKTCIENPIKNFEMHF